MDTNETLSLKDFVKTTLVDINNAIIEAHDLGVPITYQEFKDGTHPSVKYIDFDIAIQISEKTNVGKSKQGGLEISVVNIGFGSNKKKTQEQNIMNRIKFSVDVFLGSKAIKKDETISETQ